MYRDGFMDFYGEVETELELKYSYIEPDLDQVASMQENGMSAFEVAEWLIRNTE